MVNPLAQWGLGPRHHAAKHHAFRLETAEEPAQSAIHPRIVPSRGGQVDMSQHTPGIGQADVGVGIANIKEENH